MLGEVGDPVRQAGGERAVGIRQWRRLDILRMSEGTGDGPGTTSSHAYAQSTYHMCIMCDNSFRMNNYDVSRVLLYLSVSEE